jgi:trypsin-like peptidase
MGDGGVREYPRPPRRVPADASGTSLLSRTAIEARPGKPERPRPPARPPRAWYLLPLLIAMVLAGAGVGWLLRERADRFDLNDILDEAGPAVVRVRASSCSGSGLATGLLIDDTRVLTVGSALTGPVSVAIETADGRVRPVRVDGVDEDGVAVLEVLGDPLGITPVPLADSTPADGLDVPVLGYIDGRQDVDLHAVMPGGGADLTGIASRLPADAAGSAVLDRQGRAIGLLTAPSATGTRAVGLDVLQEFKDGSREKVFAGRPSDCTEAKGPQAPVVPELDGPEGDLAEQAQRLLGDYLTALNRHDAERVHDLFTGDLEESESQAVPELEKRYRMQYTFGAVIRNVQDEEGGARVQMTHVSLKQPTTDTENLVCLRYDIAYNLDRVDGQLRIASVAPARPNEDSYRPCTSD